MNMKQISLFVIAALSVAFTAKSATAQIVVDQFADAFNAPNPSGELGGPVIADFQNALQTFTVGVSGTLATIEVQVQQSSDPNDPPIDSLVVSILGTTAGVPAFSQNLGSVSLPPASIPLFDDFASGPFTAFDVSGLGIAVAPGDVLAIELSYAASDGSYFVYDSEVNVYDGGTSYTFEPFTNFFTDTSPRDLGFRTSVLIPEPASLALVVLGGLLLKRRLR